MITTFLAGQFYPGASITRRLRPQRRLILALMSTPDPDIYNQTTPAEIGGLLEDIYQCNLAHGGGAFNGTVFPGEFTQA